MVELSSLRVRDAAHPNGQIAIEVSGLRPGEKLYEELLIGDDPQPTQLARIMKAREHFLPWPQLQQELETLNKVLSAQDFQAARTLLQRLVGYTPTGPVVDWVQQAQQKAAKADGHGVQEGEDDSEAYKPRRA